MDQPDEDFLDHLVAGDLGEDNVKFAAQTVHAGFGLAVGLLLPGNELAQPLEFSSRRAFCDCLYDPRFQKSPRLVDVARLFRRRTPYECAEIEPELDDVICSQPV